MRILSVLFLSLLFLSSCVSKKKYRNLDAQRIIMSAELENMQKQDSLCRSQKMAMEQVEEKLSRQLQDRDRELLLTKNSLQHAEKKVEELNSQLDFLKKNNNELLARLSDLAVVSKTGADNIQKSLEAINEQGRYIRDLNNNIQRKDSLNLALVTNLKRSLGNINDEDVTIEVRKGVVYVSLSDKLLFRSGSSDISNRADAVLSKIAKVVNDHKEIDILVEGHTDNVPIKNDCMTDNWDLSTKRATAIVRLLQKKYGVQPERMTAAGRSEFVPKEGNDSAEGRSTNRRTDIIITPKLDQFFQLMEPNPSSPK